MFDNEYTEDEIYYQESMKLVNEIELNKDSISSLNKDEILFILLSNSIYLYEGSLVPYIQVTFALLFDNPSFILYQLIFNGALIIKTLFINSNSNE